MDVIPSSDETIKLLQEIHNQNVYIGQLLKSYLEYVEKYNAQNRPVKIQDINMPFWSLVGFLLKVSFASIPAMIILGILYFILLAFFRALL